MDTTFETIPTTSPAAATAAPPRRWPGRVLTAIPALFLAFDVAIKFANPPAVAEASLKLGLPLELG